MFLENKNRPDTVEDIKRLKHVLHVTHEDMAALLKIPEDQYYYYWEKSSDFEVITLNRSE